MKKVVIMRGIPGSGKSTYIKEHYPKAVVCSADEFFTDRKVGFPDEYRFDPSKIGEAHASCMAKFLTFLDREIDLIVVDNTNVHRWEFMNYYTIAQMKGWKVEIVEMPVTTVEQLQQCINRNVHNVPAEAISRMAVEFESLEK